MPTILQKWSRNRYHLKGSVVKTLRLVKYFEERPLSRSISILEHSRLVDIRTDLVEILENWEHSTKESRERATEGRIGIGGGGEWK